MASMLYSNLNLLWFATEHMLLILEKMYLLQSKFQHLLKRLYQVTLGCSRLLYGFTAAQMDSSSHFLSVVFHWLIQAVASGMQHIHGTRQLKISVAEISSEEDCFVKTRLLIVPTFKESSITNPSFWCWTYLLIPQLNFGLALLKLKGLTVFHQLVGGQSRLQHLFSNFDSGYMWFTGWRIQAPLA